MTMVQCIFQQGADILLLFQLMLQVGRQVAGQRTYAMQKIRGLLLTKYG